MASDRIVAIGLLTANDLRRLGDTFTRHIPVPSDESFADLLAKLDEADASLQGKGAGEVPPPIQTCRIS